MQDNDLMRRGAAVVPSDSPDPRAEYGGEPPEHPARAEAEPATEPGEPPPDGSPVSPSVSPCTPGPEESVPVSRFSGKSPESRAAQLANLRKGSQPGARPSREGRLAALDSKEGVLAELRRMVLTGGDTAAVASAKALLESYAADEEREEDAPISRVWTTVNQWLEHTRLLSIEQERRTDWTFAPDHRCRTCKRCGEVCGHLDENGNVRAEYSASARAKLAARNGGAHE